MSNARRLEDILNAAQAQEKSYAWVEAAKLYEQALDAVGQGESAKRGEIQERLGYSFYRAAFQAETRKDFTRLIGLSAEAYVGAAAQLEALESPNKQARMVLCRAVATYNRSWLAEDPTDRTALLDECRTLCKDAAKAYEAVGDHVGQGRACNELLTCLDDRGLLAQDAEELENIVEEYLEYGEQAIHALAETEDEAALARAYYQLSEGYTAAIDVHESIEKRKNLGQRALSSAEKAVGVAEPTGDKYLIGMSNVTLDAARWALHVDTEAAVKHLEKVLESAKTTRDTLLIARVCERQLRWRNLNAPSVEDPDKRREENHKIIQAAEGVIAKLELFSHLFIWAYYPHSTCHIRLARDETDLEKKRGWLTKAAELAGKYLPRAQRSGSPMAVVVVLHPLSVALEELATLETGAGERRRLLTRAAEHREAAVNLHDHLYPFSLWDRGFLYSRSARIKVELAKMEADSQKKRDLLTSAAMTLEESVNLIRRNLQMFAESPALYAPLGAVQNWFSGVLNQLYSVTGKKTYLERAVKSCEDTVATWEKADLRSRIAETHWQMAKFYNQLGEHLKAAQAFAAAAKGYRQAAAKLPQLTAFYKDHAAYMQAWSEIETARHHHAAKQYGLAREHYEKAAKLHQSTERWAYFSPNYVALALVDEAEDLSRKEQAEEAKALFERAATQFLEAKASLESKLDTIDVQDEKEVATQLAKAADSRRDYCLGRIALEEAKILDRQGDHGASARRYGAAAEQFQKVADAMELELDRRELRPLVELCRAWHAMTRAEAETSPALYLEAATLFEEARKHSADEKARLLDLGHSRFCKALEAGTRFGDTRDLALYSTAKQHLEAAANYYLKAGLKSASEYAKATQRLFDAYMYTHKADTETNLTKKAEFYRIAGKFLQASAGSYMKAKHPEKSEEVQRLLESVQEEHQLATSLTGVLHAPTATTTSFSTPTPTHEQATGLERFEHADVQANLILRVKEGRVGEDIRLAIEVVNAGKAPALLIKVDEVIPEGFEIREVPAMYTFEDSYINLKGKRLNPLKTEDVKVVVQPQAKGTHTIRPRILYIDETGKYKSHEPEPVTVTVKELGIKGWIKGER